MNIDVLREALREDALLAGPPPADPYESVLARRQHSDRRRLVSLATGLTVALIAVIIPVGISLVGPRDSQVAASPEIPYANVFAGPTRGSLAAETGFVEGVRQLSWTLPDGLEMPSGPDAPVETRKVVFAGDVAGGRWALVVGQNTAIPSGNAADPELQTDAGALSDIAAVWYVGPPGAAPEDMQLATLPRGVAADRPASLYDGATGALVVVAARGDSVEVSERPDVAADASVTRSYTDAETTDGVAVVALGPNSLASAGMPAVQYRVTREGVVVAQQSPESSAAVQGSAQPALPLQYLRSPGEPSRGPGDTAEFMAAQILNEYGLDPDEVELLVHYEGALPGSGAEPAELTVLTVTLPSGAVVIRADWTQQISEAQGPSEGPAFQGGTCADELSAARVPAAQLTLALRCDVLSGTESPDSESTLVVLTPVGGTGSYAEATGDGASITVAFDSNGVAMVSFPSGAHTVGIRAADSTILDKVQILSP